MSNIDQEVKTGLNQMVFFPDNKTGETYLAYYIFFSSYLAISIGINLLANRLDLVFLPL